MIIMNSTSNSEHTRKLFHDAALGSSPIRVDGRIGRGRYIIDVLIVSILNYLMTVLCNGMSVELTGMLPYIIVLLSDCYLIVEGIKRCHDFNHSGWYQIIPLYIFIMIFKEGDKGEKRYGK